MSDRIFVVTFKDGNYVDTSENEKVVHRNDGGVVDNFKNDEVVRESTKNLPTQSQSQSQSKIKPYMNRRDEINWLSEKENKSDEDQERYERLIYELAYPVTSNVNKVSDSVWATISKFKKYFGTLGQIKKKEIAKLVVHLKDPEITTENKTQYYNMLLYKYQNDPKFQDEITKSYRYMISVPKTGGNHTKKRRTRSDGRSKKRRY